MSRTGLLQLLALFGALLSHSVLAKLTCPKNTTGYICYPGGCFSNGDINNINYDVPSLGIYNSNLNNISADFLCRLPKLTKLTIRSNITFLPAGFFNCSKNLLSVTLEQNNFTPQPGVFNGLVSIIDLDLSRNNIKYLNSDVFWHLRTLQELDLSYNNITEMPSDIFKDLTGLKKLWLKNNQLTRIPDGLFSSTTELKILYLSNNYFYLIYKNNFKFLRNLEYLNMESNQLVYIFHDTFVNNKKLKIVKFAFNCLNASTSDIFSPLPSFRYNLDLEEIDLSHNTISVIHSGWRNLPNLRYLRLSNNDINNLKFEDLQFKTRTIEVDLQKNKLKTVDLTTLECLKYNSRSNDIHNIYVGLRFNPLECTCDSFLRYINGVMSSEVYNNFKLHFDSDDICMKERNSCTFRNDPCINN